MLYAGLVNGKLVHSCEDAHEVHLEMFKQMKGNGVCKCVYLALELDYPNEQVTLSNAFNAVVRSGYELSLSVMGELPEWLVSHAVLHNVRGV